MGLILLLQANTASHLDLGGIHSFALFASANVMILHGDTVVIELLHGDFLLLELGS